MSCVLPALCVELHEHFRAGRHDQARALQQRLTPLAKLVTTGLGVAALKKAMDLAGYAGGEPRAPLAPLNADATMQVRDALAPLMAGGPTNRTKGWTNASERGCCRRLVCVDVAPQERRPAYRARLVARDRNFRRAAVAGRRGHARADLHDGRPGPVVTSLVGPPPRSAIRT